MKRQVSVKGKEYGKLEACEGNRKRGKEMNWQKFVKGIREGKEYGKSGVCEWNMKKERVREGRSL